jgi:ABC-2 type transport system ATP-binding protein
MTAIELTGVVKSYGAAKAVSDMSLSVDRGQMFGLIGPDGAGKTTAIRLICGLLAPDAGRIRVLGRDPVREHRDITERVGYLSQRFSLYGDLSVDENIEFFAEIHGVRDYRARREQLLELTQLIPFRGRLADRLSGGMKQKLALACTLVHEPEVVLLDEPTTGVDPISRREFWKLLSSFLARGVTILMSTPYLDEAERCTRVALVHEGRVLAADEPARLRGLITEPMVEVMTGGSAGAVDLVGNMPGVVSAQSFGDRLHIALAAEADAVERFGRALQATPLADAPVRRVLPSLEDVFIARLGKESDHA